VPPPARDQGPSVRDTRTRRHPRHRGGRAATIRPRTIIASSASSADWPQASSSGHGCARCQGLGGPQPRRCERLLSRRRPPGTELALSQPAGRAPGEGPTEEHQRNIGPPKYRKLRKTRQSTMGRIFLQTGNIRAPRSSMVRSRRRWRPERSRPPWSRRLRGLAAGVWLGYRPSRARSRRCALL
jgi:hypothetical protein